MSLLINALQLGAIYALIAIGYSMVYGIIGLINFAHGEVLMLGGYTAFIAISAGLHPIISVILAIIVPILISFLIEKLAYRPLRSAPKKLLFITAIGISILFQNLAQLIFGASGKPFPNAKILPDLNMNLFNQNISLVSLITISISIILMFLLNFLIKRTKIGKAMRATSEDMQTARLMGININNVISFTFALGAALAGVGAILYLCKYPIVNPQLGYMPGMKVFIAAVLGGIGLIHGAVIGGFVIGFIEIFAVSLGFSTWVDGIVFGILILVLLIRPVGIMGRKVQEKV